MILELPMPPSANALFGTRKDGRRYTTKKYKDWQIAAGWEYHAQRRRITPIRGPYTIHIVLSAKGRRGDCDNRIKATQDLLVKLGVTPDDRLCDDSRASWDETGTVPKGRCRVEVRPSSQQQKAA